MKLKTSNPFATVMTVVALAGTVLAPVTGMAQSRRQQADHRQNTQNEWRNLTIGSAAAAVIGLATHNKTLTTIGVAGALYSGYRLSQDDNRGNYRNDRNDREWRLQQERNRERDQREREIRDRNLRDRNDWNWNSGYYRDPHANPDGVIRNNGRDQWNGRYSNNHNKNDRNKSDHNNNGRGHDQNGRHHD